MGENVSVGRAIFGLAIMRFALIIFITVLYLSFMCGVEWQHFCVEVALLN